MNAIKGQPPVQMSLAQPLARNHKILQVQYPLKEILLTTIQYIGLSTEVHPIQRIR